MDQRPAPLTVRTFQFACQIVRLYCELVRVRGFPFDVARQLLKAGTSIGANLEEAKAGGTDPELIARSSVALREARETKYWLRLIRVTELAPAVPLEAALDEADQLSAILTVWVRRLRERHAATRKSRRGPASG